MTTPDRPRTPRSTAAAIAFVPLVATKASKADDGFFGNSTLALADSGTPGDGQAGSRGPMRLLPRWRHSVRQLPWQPSVRWTMVADTPKLFHHNHIPLVDRGREGGRLGGMECHAPKTPALAGRIRRASMRSAPL